MSERMMTSPSFGYRGFREPLNVVVQRAKKDRPGIKGQIRAGLFDLEHLRGKDNALIGVYARLVVRPTTVDIV